MRILLDTHLLLWSLSAPRRLSAAARKLMDDPGHELCFSVISLWEVAVKRALGRSDFQVDPQILRRVLLDNDYCELPLTGEHALTIAALPPLHKDPFDRILIAQALSDGIPFVTADKELFQYPGLIRRV
jgi:PIN domain nuclease of toxin-antitoxin system